MYEWTGINSLITREISSTNNFTERNANYSDFSDLNREGPGKLTHKFGSL